MSLIESPSEDITRTAFKALEVARKLRPRFQAFIRMLARNPKLQLQWTHSTPRTDGRTVWLRVPYEWGSDVEHGDPKFCGRRDPLTTVQMCKACAVFEDAQITAIHEAAHIIFETFSEPSEGTKQSAIRRAVEAHFGPEDDSPPAHRARAQIKMYEEHGASNYMVFAQSISPWLALILNALEDTRVNAEMSSAREGTRLMFSAHMHSVFARGIRTSSGEIIRWHTQVLNLQMTIGLFCATSGVDYDLYLDPKVVDALHDSEVKDFTESAQQLLKVDDTYSLTLLAYMRLRELGFFLDEDEEEVDEDDPGKGEPCEDGEPSDDEETEGGKPSGDSDDSDEEDGEAGDGDDGDSEEDGDGEGESPGDDGTESTGKDAEGGEESDDDTKGDFGDETGESSGGESVYGHDHVDEVRRVLAEFSGHGDDDEYSDPEDSPDGEDSEWDDSDPDEDDSWDPDNAHEVEGRNDGASGGDVVKKKREAIRVAIKQEEHFDRPAKGVSEVNIHRFDDERASERTAWDRGYGYADEIDIPETILGPSLLKMRVAFTENRKAKVTPNLKRGRVDAKKVGRRIATDDRRLFKKRSTPGKRDYFVVGGADVSGSTSGGAISRIKQALYAQAELMDRLGIPFALYAHSGSFGHYSSSGRSDLEIFVIKDPNEPWGREQKKALAHLGSFSANLDGHTLEFYRKVLDGRPEQEKMIMYYTDGAMPLENFDEELEVLKENILICRKRGYTLLGVGVGTDSPRDHGLDTIRLDSVEDVPKVVDGLRERLQGKIPHLPV